MGRGSSKIGSGGASGVAVGAMEVSQQEVNSAITDFLNHYGRQSIQAITSLGGVSGRIPTANGGVLAFSLSQSKDTDVLGNRQFVLSFMGRNHYLTSFKAVRNTLMENAGY